MTLFTFDEALPTVDGLTITSNFLSSAEGDEVMSFVDQLPWSTTLSRRTQHYGHVYDYRGRPATADRYAQPMPYLLTLLAERLAGDGLVAQQPNQCIVNEYLVDADLVQGVSAHVDDVRQFGDEITTVSLLEAWSMRFTHPANPPVEVQLPVHSAAVMRGAARYDWKHEIAHRKYERTNGVRIRRHRRVSLTFRTAVK